MIGVEVLEGRRVEEVWVGWSLRLVFDKRAPGGFVELTHFRFTDPDGVEHDIAVEEDPMGAGCACGVLHQRVTRAAVRDWELSLEFDTGARLVCPPHPEREAWEAAIPGLETITCPPGGASG